MRVGLRGGAGAPTAALGALRLRGLALYKSGGPRLRRTVVLLLCWSFLSFVELGARYGSIDFFF